MNTENTDTPQTPADGVPTDRRPIGYWLRVVDALLTREFASAFEGEDVSRREWMLLSIVAGDIDRPGFAERLARKGKKLHGLEERGWVIQAADGSWSLTDEGRAAKERLGGIVDGLRSRVAGAVSPDDFATTMASLEAIARELGWDEESRMPRHGFGPRGRRGFGPGFRPGFGPGFGPGRGFGPGHGDGRGRVFPHDGAEHDRGGEAFGPRHGEGFGPRHGEGFGPRHGEGFGPRHGEGFGPRHGHGGHECGPHAGHPHRRHGRGRGGKRAEQAYERGFDAGFARGQAADAAPTEPAAAHAAPVNDAA